jgi:hypothetical protein
LVAKCGKCRRANSVADETSQPGNAREWTRHGINVGLTRQGAGHPRQSGRACATTVARLERNRRAIDGDDQARDDPQIHGPIMRPCCASGLQIPDHTVPGESNCSWKPHPYRLECVHSGTIIAAAQEAPRGQEGAMAQLTGHISRRSLLGGSIAGVFAMPALTSAIRAQVGQPAHATATRRCGCACRGSGSSDNRSPERFSNFFTIWPVFLARLTLLRHVTPIMRSHGCTYRRTQIGCVALVRT